LIQKIRGSCTRYSDIDILPRNCIILVLKSLAAKDWPPSKHKPAIKIESVIKTGPHLNSCYVIYVVLIPSENK
jgi:hypothetical protein